MQQRTGGKCIYAHLRTYTQPKQPLPAALLPNCKPPLGPDLCRQIPITLVGTKLGSKKPNWGGPLFLSLGALLALLESTGYRKV